MKRENAIFFNVKREIEDFISVIRDPDPPPFTTLYRSYKNFNESDFKRDLCEAMSNTNPTDYDSFQDVFN